VTAAASGGDRLKVALLTREFPPEVYGGAGVHVEYLARELAPFVDLAVHCQGKPRTNAVAHGPWSLLSEANFALQTISTDVSMAAALDGCQLAHSHTWYANLAGHLGSLLHGIPHVVTTGRRRSPSRAPPRSSPCPRACGPTSCRPTRTSTRRRST
jgi:starch synthase